MALTVAAMVLLDWWLSLDHLNALVAALATVSGLESQCLRKTPSCSTFPLISVDGLTESTDLDRLTLWHSLRMG